jgi:hypothetical protein
VIAAGDPVLHKAVRDLLAPGELTPR